MDLALNNLQRLICHKTQLAKQLKAKTVLFLTIQFSMSTNFQWFQVLQTMSNNSIKDKTFVYTQLNDQDIQFRVSTFFFVYP